MAKQTSDVEAKKFPDTLYITRQTDNHGDAFGLQADYAVEDIDEGGDGGLVGVYELVRVDRLSVTKILGPR